MFLYENTEIRPSCHHDERFGNMLWPEGTDEWEVIKNYHQCLKRMSRRQLFVARYAEWIRLFESREKSFQKQSNRILKTILNRWE